jgi:crossover junction endodeoxyribonuclease RusA
MESELQNTNSAELNLDLPFPPSVNGYWRAILRGNLCTQIISKKGREYAEAVNTFVNAAGLTTTPLEGRLEVTILLCAPDRRRRDVDNYSKAVLDSLTKAGVWEDDSQIDRLTVVRGAVENRCTVSIRSLE